MTIIIDNNENIRTIILNRPEKLNSVNLKMATELNQAVNNAANDKSVQCLVITGNGGAFLQVEMLMKWENIYLKLVTYFMT